MTTVRSGTICIPTRSVQSKIIQTQLDTMIAQLVIGLDWDRPPTISMHTSGSTLIIIVLCTGTPVTDVPVTQA